MKWYEKFSCNSNCKFNPEKECPREMWEVLWDLNHLELCDKDLRYYNLYNNEDSISFRSDILY